MTLPGQDGRYNDIPDASYHSDRGSLSVSGAKLLLPPSCPAKFRQNRDNPPKSKREYDFGHLAHMMVLGKGADIAVLDPKVHGLKKDGTVAESPRATAGWKLAELEARRRDQVPVHVDEFATAAAMAQRVKDHPVAGRLFSEGAAEQSLYATDAATGVKLRGRIDWIEPCGYVDDYKTSTTANPVELERKFWQFGYFMQAAWYLDLVIALEISESPRFRFVVQEKDPPYLVTVVEYDDAAISEGRRLNRVAIETYARCCDTDTWPGYADTDIVPLSLPGWVFRDAPLDHTTLYDLIEID